MKSLWKIFDAEKKADSKPEIGPNLVGGEQK